MDRTKLGRDMDRYLRCTEDLITACTPGDDQNTDATFDKAILSFRRSVVGFEKERARYSNLAQGKKCAAVAKTWLDAYHDAQVLPKLQAHLTVVRDSAQVPALTTNSPMRRYV